MIQTSATLPDKNAIRPFHVNVPEAELTELRRRINSTKWPERELVADATQGVQLATVQALARYWGTEYDWRKVVKVIASSACPDCLTLAATLVSAGDNHLVPRSDLRCPAIHKQFDSSDETGVA
jgi:Epoxide hydrolase N terminus